MITACKHCDSRGRANERARTGIERERARAAFQNIHSHIGQWTFGYILSGAGEGGSSLNAWDLRKEFDRAWEWQCHGSRQRTLLKRRHNRRACLKTLSLLHGLSFFCFYDFVFQGQEPCFLKTFSKQMNTEGHYLVSLQTPLSDSSSEEPEQPTASSWTIPLSQTDGGGADFMSCSDFNHLV